MDNLMLLYEELLKESARLDFILSIFQYILCCILIWIIIGELKCLITKNN